MTLLSSFGLAAAMFVLAITPGPGVFATISKALSSGFRHAVPLVMGIVVGDILFLMFAIYGLSMIAETFSVLFIAIKFIGGGYLIWLGISLLRSKVSAVDSADPKLQSSKFSFLAGLSITCANPKVILFYLSFLPTFLDLAVLSTLDIFIVALIVSLVLGLVLLFYAFTAARASLLLKSENAQNKMDKAAGCLLIGTGTVLLSKAW